MTAYDRMLIVVSAAQGEPEIYSASGKINSYDSANQHFYYLVDKL